MNSKDFKFLEDAPIGKTTDGFFDFYHKNVAPALRTILENDTCVHTIGLFGRWGTGKSTIVKLLKDDGVTDAKIIEFDCWKYEKDPLRRQLLLQIAKDLQLGKKQIDELEKEFYFSISEKIAERLAISWPHLWKVGIFSLPFALAVFLLAWQIYPDPNQWKQLLATSLAFVLAIAFLIDKFVTDDFKKIIMISPTTGTKNQLDSAELFEKSFIRTIKNAKGPRKIIIVIDNLDRVDSKIATEVLSTLKTFLEIKDENLDNKKVVFLVPCDFDAIKKAAPSDELADEFLRKIFNVIVWTPEFINADLQSYTSNLLKQTGSISTLIADEDVILVIDSAFSGNPREIKQFINNLIAAVIVATQSEVRDIIEKNIPYLAKVLVLMHKFPDAFQRLKENWFDPENIVDISKESALKNFMLSTSRITVADAEPFIYLKSPVVSAQLNKSDEIRQALIEGKDEEVKKLISEESNNIDNLLSFLLALFSKYQNQQEILFRIFQTQLNVFAESGITISRKQYYDNVARLLDSKIWPYFEKFNTNIVFSNILSNANLERKLRGQIVGRYILALSTDSLKNFQNPNLVKDIFTNLLTYKNLLSTEQTSNIAQAIVESYSTQLEILEIFKDSPDKGVFITAKAFDQFIKSINNLNFGNYLPILSAYKDILAKPNLFNILFGKIFELLSSENSESPAYRAQKDTLFNHFTTLFNEFSDSLGAVGQKERADLVRLFMQTFDNISPWDNRTLLINIFQYLKPSADAPLQEEIKNRTSQYFQSASPEKVKEVFGYWKPEFAQKFLTEYLQYLLPRTINNQPTLKVVYEIADKTKKLEILKHVITQQADSGLEFIKTLDSSDYDRVEVIRNLLEKAKSLSPTDRRGIYSFVQEKLSKNDDVSVKEIAVAQIKTLLNTDDASQQEIGYNLLTNSSFMNEEQKIEVGKSTLDFLRQPGRVLIETHRFALKGVTYLYESLQETPKRDFVYSLFEMLQADKNKPTLDVAIELLLQVKPMFTEHEKDFKYLLDKLKKWPEGDNRNMLIEKILQLKSSSKSKEEKDFWDSIDSLIPKKE